MKAINRRRIKEAVQAVQENQVVRDFVKHKTVVLDENFSKETLDDAMGYLLELVITHLTECVDRINGLESTYAKWHNDLIDFDKLAKIVQAQENKSDKINSLLKKLGYTNANK